MPRIPIVIDDREIRPLFFDQLPQPEKREGGRADQDEIHAVFGQEPVDPLSIPKDPEFFRYPFITVRLVVEPLNGRSQRCQRRGNHPARSGGKGGTVGPPRFSGHAVLRLDALPDNGSRRPSLWKRNFREGQRPEKGCSPSSRFGTKSPRDSTSSASLPRSSSAATWKGR